VVYDPFVGAGTTIIAAETTKRIAYAMDIDPVYVDLAIERWQQFTGQKAVLAETQETFEHVGIRRHGGQMDAQER
jgi:DNA modification methylase